MREAMLLPIDMSARVLAIVTNIVAARTKVSINYASHEKSVIRQTFQLAFACDCHWNCIFRKLSILGRYLPILLDRASIHKAQDTMLN